MAGLAVCDRIFTLPARCAFGQKLGAGLRSIFAVHGAERFTPFLINLLSSRNVDPLPRHPVCFLFSNRFEALSPATPEGRS